MPSASPSRLQPAKPRLWQRVSQHRPCPQLEGGCFPHLLFTLVVVVATTLCVCVAGKGGHGSHGGSKSSPTEVDLKRLLLTTLEGSVVGGALGCMVRAQSSVLSPQCSPPLSRAGALSSIALLFALLVHFLRRRCCLCCWCTIHDSTICLRCWCTFLDGAVVCVACTFVLL